MCRNSHHLSTISQTYQPFRSPITINNHQSSIPHTTTRYWDKYGYCVNETDLVYDYAGEVSVGSTFAVCLQNVMDIMLAPVYSTGELVNVSVQLTINNLMEINELKNSASFDFFFWMHWVDPRLSIPAMWENLHPPQSSIDITQYVRTLGVQRIEPSIWLPDIIFPEISDVKVDNKYIKLYPGGSIRYLQHIKITILQVHHNNHNKEKKSTNHLKHVSNSTHVHLFCPKSFSKSKSIFKSSSITTYSLPLSIS